MPWSEEQTERLAAMADRQLKADLQDMLKTESGRRIAAWLIYDLGALESISFRNNAPGSPVPMGIKDGMGAAQHLAFHEGRRDMAADLYNQLADADPAGLAQTMQERLQYQLQLRDMLTRSQTKESR